MKCEKFSRSMSLYLDGRLDETSARALREHLTTCRRCAEILATLESVRSAAQAAKTPEPRAGYWDTFSSRVMERIDAAGERAREPWWQRGLRGVVPTPGRRLRVAAGVASIALVVAVGALFIERQGDRAIPPVAQAPEVRTPGVERPDVQSTRPPLAGEAEEPPVIAAEKEAASPPVEKKAAAAVPEKKVSAPAPAQRTAEAPAAPQEKAAPRTDGVRTTSPEKLARSRVESFAITKDAVEAADAQSLKAGSPAANFLVGGASLHRISDDDTSATEEELRTVIAAWKTHFQTNPEDSLNDDGYCQVAIAYCLLARRTGDAETADEGARLIGEYLARTQDPNVKEFLTLKLAEIEGFKKK